MTEDKLQHRSKHNIIEELRTIREAIENAPASSNDDIEIPLLDEVIAETEDNDLAKIPLLADSIVVSDTETHQLAVQCWKLVEKELYQLTSTMDNPMSGLTTELLQGMSSQLATNWEAIFSSQSPQQLKLWEQLLIKQQN